MKSGVEVRFEAEGAKKEVEAAGEKEKPAEQKKKPKDPRNSRAHLSSVLRRAFSALMKTLGTRVETGPGPRVVAISGVEFRMPLPSSAPGLILPDPKGKRKHDPCASGLEDLVEAAISLAKKAQGRTGDALGLSDGKKRKEREEEGLGEVARGFVERILVG
jgi:hypothetical protein